MAHAAQPYTAEAMWELKRLGDPAISPDGRLAVVPVTKYDVEKNKGDTDLWLVPTKPGKARQLTSDAASDCVAGVEPGRRADRVRLQARRGQAAAAVRHRRSTAAKRGASPTCRPA